MTLYKLSDTEKRQLLDRFVRYVKVDTQSDDNATCFPSTEKQKDLSRILADELKTLGCQDAMMDEWGYVYASLPSNLSAGKNVPAVGFVAHVDTYPGTSGANVKPQIIENYQGQDLLLVATGEKTLADKNPNLKKCLGHTIIHTDGTTLLGADDKAGVAEIMTMLAWIQAHPEFQHGEIRIAFTPDEEVGRGTEQFSVDRFKTRYAYTFDGSDLGEVEDETFCADGATVTITGHDVHPGYAKNVMINAVRVASEIVARLPKDRLPETTENKEPYLHPHAVSGDVTKAELKFLVRAFTEAELKEREDVLKGILEGVEKDFPGVQIKLDIKESYRNMIYKIAEDPKVLDYALEAVKRQGLTPIRKAIRGGTDGARLSFMGVLTPNVWAGGQSFHSVNEWVSLEWMSEAVGTGLQLLQVWVEKA